LGIYAHEIILRKSADIILVTGVVKMLEFHPNTLACMTASLERCCKHLESDTPEARKFIAEKLKECTKDGKVDMLDLEIVGEKAVAELNASLNARSSGWRALFQWSI
jgi:hypothetical protein